MRARHTGVTCINSATDSATSTDSTGISRPLVPRLVPRRKCCPVTVARISPGRPDTATTARKPAQTTLCIATVRQVSDPKDDPVRRGLVEILKHSSVTLDGAGMRELLPILQKFLADLNQAGSGDKALTYWLANLADGQIRAVLGSGPAAPSVDLVFPPNVTFTASGGLAMTPAGMFGNARATAVPLPADIVRSRRELSPPATLITPRRCCWRSSPGCLPSRGRS